MLQLDYQLLHMYRRMDWIYFLFELSIEEETKRINNK